MRKYSQYVPGLDEVLLRSITYGDYEKICDLVENVEDSQKALTFTKLVFAELLVDKELIVYDSLKVHKRSD